MWLDILSRLRKKKRMMWGYWTTVHGLASAFEVNTFLFRCCIINFATQQDIILEISHAHIMSKLLKDLYVYVVYYLYG